MVNEEILYLLNPHSIDGWLVIKTDKSFFSLRFGGIKKENVIDERLYEKEPLHFNNKVISKICIDDEWVYILCKEGEVLAWGLIDTEGNLGYYLKKESDYEPDFFTVKYFTEILA
jgi:alpha-tubulin suppressor-like RCC1 family protein